GQTGDLEVEFDADLAMAGATSTVLVRTSRSGSPRHLCCLGLRPDGGQVRGRRRDHLDRDGPRLAANRILRRAVAPAAGRGGGGGGGRGGEGPRLAAPPDGGVELSVLVDRAVDDPAPRARRRLLALERTGGPGSAGQLRGDAGAVPRAFAPAFGGD